MSEKGGRLWPVLTALVVLLAGAMALEIYAGNRRAPPLVVEIDATATAATGDDDDPGQAQADGTEPLSAGQRRARELARREDFDAALALFDAEIAAHPKRASLFADAGYWLLAAHRYQEAITRLGRALALAGDDPRIYYNLGLAQRRSGDLEAAAVSLRTALKLRPAYSAARVALGILQRRQGDLDGAVATLERAVAYGSNEHRATAQVALGRAYLAGGRRKDAAGAFIRAIGWAPAQAELRIQIARAYVAAGTPKDLERARSFAEDARDLAPDLPAVHTTLGRARELLEDPKGAESAYALALRLDPTYELARRRLVHLQLARGATKNALVNARALLAAAPEDPENHFLVGLAAAHAGELDTARKSYGAAITARGGVYPEAQFNLGLLEKAAGNLDVAIRAYRAAVAARPDYAAARNNLGLAYLAAGNIAAARRAFEGALAADPTYAGAAYNLGRLEMERKQFGAAIAAFDRAVAARPDYREALLNLGVAYSRAGDAAGAVRVDEGLVAAHPRYRAAWYNLSVAYGRLDRDADEYRAIARAVELAPDHIPSLRKLAKLEVGRHDYAAAQRLYGDLLDHAPADRDARLGLAAVYRRTHAYTGCLERAEQVLADAPKDTRAQRLVEDCRAAASTAPSP